MKKMDVFAGRSPKEIILNPPGLEVGTECA